MSSEMAKRRGGGIPASALGQAPAAPAQSEMTKMRIALGDLVQLPGYGQVYMRILGSAKMEEIEAATFRSLRALELPPVELHVGTYNLHRFRRVLAEAVRCAGDRATPFGTLDDWAEEPDGMLVASIRIYQDLKARLDPTTNPQLSDDQAEELVELFKKKDFAQLRSFDAATLASWLVSGAVQLSSSPTPASRSSDTSPE